MDVWEHAYILDQGAAGRPKYIEAFMKVCVLFSLLCSYSLLFSALLFSCRPSICCLSSDAHSLPHPQNVDWAVVEDRLANCIEGKIAARK